MADGREGRSSGHPRRRVLLTNVSLRNGGLERQLLLLARSLPTTWEARIWTLEGGAFDCQVHEAAIQWTCRPRRWRFDPMPALALWRLMWDWRPHVVHAWHWMPAAAAVPACHALNIPLIDGSIRMGAVPRQFGRPRRSIMHCSSLVVANSQAGLNAWRVGTDRGRVIYNAFDEARLADARGASSTVEQVGDQPFTVVMAARMTPQKDYPAVIEAARLLQREAPGTCRFHLVGTGAEKADLMRVSCALRKERGGDLLRRWS